MDLLEDVSAEMETIQQENRRLQNELNRKKFELEQVFNAMGDLDEATAKIFSLEGRVSELENNKEKLLLERKNEDESLSKEALSQEIDQWKDLYNQLKNAFSILETNFQQNQENMTQIVVERCFLQSQVDHFIQEKYQKSPTQKPVETRITIEKDSEEFFSSVDSLPFLAEFNEILEQMSQTYIVRRGIPLSQEVLRKIRAFWGPRPFRPFLRYLILFYFILLHVFLFCL